VGELLPLSCGLLLGVALGRVRSSLQLPVGAVLAVVLGMIATVATGEATISWAFVLIDIPIVAVGALVARLVVRRLGQAPRRAPAGGA
jgi:xanthosine utilization system XapX-like protein